MSVNLNRITGMATGMDTDAMVKKLVSAQQAKLDKQEKYKILATWKKDAYADVNKSLANFIINARKDLGLTKSFGSTDVGISYKNLDYIKKVTVSNESVASASASADAMDGSFSLEVGQIAKGASKSIQVKSGDNLGMDFQMDLNVNGEVHRISLNGIGGNVTYDQLAKKINEMDIGVNASYAIDSYGNGVFNMTTKETGAGMRFSASVVNGGNDTFNIAAQSIATGKNAMVKFNGVDLEYESNSFEIQGVKLNLKNTTKAGEALQVNVTKNTDELFNKIKKFVDDYNKLLDDVGKQLGTPRKKVNNRTHEYFMPLTSEEKKAISEDEAKEWETNAKEGILYRDDVLSNIFNSNRLDLYKGFTSDSTKPIGGQYSHLTNIGISTARYAKGAAGGQLQIDEAKLRRALDDDPQKVMEMLFAEGEKVKDDTYVNGTRYKAGETITETQGVFSRIFSNFTAGMKDVIRTAGLGENAELYRQVDSKILVDFATKGGKSGQGGVSDLDSDIFDYEKKIETLTDLLYEREDYYYNKFARMESLVAKMQNQQNSMMAQLGRQ